MSMLATHNYHASSLRKCSHEHFQFLPLTFILLGSWWLWVLLVQVVTFSVGDGIVCGYQLIL
jgi:hypothetical protein